MQIQNIFAEEILDSRGNPTIGAAVVLQDGSSGYASVPSGASTGKYEATELRDNDPQRYNGMGVLQAVTHVQNDIAKVLVGQNAEDQAQIDQILIDLDGTPTKSRLGANAILSVSLATARAAAVSERKELFEYLSKFNPSASDIYTMPIPQMNIMNGGKHANWATDIQEYMILPIGASSLRNAVRMGSEVYHTLKSILIDKKYGVTVGDEGGFAPHLASNEEPFTLLAEAVEKAGYTLGADIVFGIDAAASEFFRDGIYHLAKEQKDLTSETLREFYQDLEKKYPILSMEDIFEEDDYQGFADSTTGDKVQVVGDDLYATNPKRLQKGVEMKATNALIIKLNQIGTLTETIHTILQARKNNIHPIVSHRSGETEDSFIADLSVAFGTGQIKAGAPARGERVAKYNRLLYIEKLLGEKAQFGRFPFSK